MGWLRAWWVVAVCCATAVAHGASSPDARLSEVRTALDAASTLWDAGRYEDAIARGEHALALREAVLEGTHPDIAECLVLLASRHLLRGNLVRAEPLLQRALALREAALGEKHPDVARTLTHLAHVYQPAYSYPHFHGSPERARPLLARALAIREEALGENHPLVAESLSYLAQLSPAGAEPLLLRALAIREAALGQHHLEVAQTLHDLGSFYTDQRSYARA
ncbi:MAG TPA: tetratricopeptide repeat protein, partial [Archangium sp.]|nr:tetratricopeptide repeat protein [Archangium sp.]